MSDLRVSLTTTGFLKESAGDEAGETMIWRMNAPVCVAEMGMMMFGGDKEWFEHVIANSMKDMAKTVQVDSASKTVFIGEDPHNEDTGLIVYSEQNDTNEYAQEFFHRWDQVKSMIMQMHVIGAEHKIMFSLVGIWREDHWIQLEVKPQGNIHILSGGPYG